MIRTLVLYSCISMLSLSGIVQSQAQSPPSNQPQDSSEKSSRDQGQPDDKKKNDRIFGVIPNYRTVEDEKKEPTRLTAKEKFKLGFQDSFDPYAYPSAAIFAGIAMAQNQTRSFGQGAAGFGKYYGTALADQTIGNMMSEIGFSGNAAPGPALFSHGQNRGRILEARPVLRQPRMDHPHRFREERVQLLGTRR